MQDRSKDLKIHEEFWEIGLDWCEEYKSGEGMMEFQQT